MKQYSKEKGERKYYFNGNCKLNGVSDDWDWVPLAKVVENVPFIIYEFDLLWALEIFEV